MLSRLKIYIHMHMFSYNKIDKNILGPNFFDPSPTRLTHLLGFWLYFLKEKDKTVMCGRPKFRQVRPRVGNPWWVMSCDTAQADVPKQSKIQKYKTIREKEVMRLTKNSKPLLGDAIWYGRGRCSRQIFNVNFLQRLSRCCWHEEGDYGSSQEEWEGRAEKHFEVPPPAKPGADVGASEFGPAGPCAQPSWPTIKMVDHYCEKEKSMKWKSLAAPRQILLLVRRDSITHEITFEKFCVER